MNPTAEPAGTSFSVSRRAAAWGVHLLTASSAPAGVMAILATMRGDVTSAFLWMAYTVVIDAIDGTLARAVGVKVVLPYVDGALLDNIVDYFTWVVAPATFVVLRGMVPTELAVVVMTAMTLSSAYGFAQTAAKTSDHFFTGFPSYWNLVVFYLYELAWSPMANAICLLTCAVLVFVPIRYVYPSRTPTLRGLTNGLGILWTLALLYVVVVPSAPHAIVTWSLLYPIYYLVLSLVLHVRHSAAP